MQRALEWARDRTALTANREWGSVLVFDDLDHATVAAQSARRFAGYERFADLTYLDRICRALAQTARRHRECDLDGRAVGSIATQVTLCQPDERIGAAEGSPASIRLLT